MTQTQTQTEPTLADALHPVPGVYDDVPEGVYRRWPLMHYSALKTIDVSMEDYIWQVEHPRPATDAMQFGSAVDLLVHEPDRAEDEIAVAPDVNRRTNAGKDDLAAFEAENDGKIILSPVDSARAIAAARAVRSHAEARKILEQGRPQVCLVWEDAETQVVCKARIDWLSTVLADFKAIRSVDSFQFVRGMLDFGWHIQAALYSDAWKTATGESKPWRWIAVRSCPPHRVVVYEPNAETLQAGRQAYRRALFAYRACSQSKHWRDPQIAIPISLPSWKLREEGIDPPESTLGF